MIKKGVLIGLFASALFLGGISQAADYSRYSTEELSRMRGTMKNASQEEREAFRQEWQKRMKELSPEERKAFGSPSNKGGKGYHQGHGRGGHGRGHGRRK